VTDGQVRLVPGTQVEPKPLIVPGEGAPAAAARKQDS
jgi:hypothetical protein